MELLIDDVRISVEREPYDENEPNKRRGSIVTCKHLPTGIETSKFHKSQIVARDEALKELERELADK